MFSELGLRVAREALQSNVHLNCNCKEFGRRGPEIFQAGDGCVQSTETMKDGLLEEPVVIQLKWSGKGRNTKCKDSGGGWGSHSQ